MQTPKKLKIIWLCAVLLILSLATSQATTYFSKGATGDPTLLTSWTNSANANPANFTSGDTFVILNGANFAIPTVTSNWVVNATTAGTAATVQINSGGTLTFTIPTGTNEKLLLGGNFVQNGTVAATATSSTATIEFTSNGSWTGSGDISGVKANVLVDSGVTLDVSGMSNAGIKIKVGNSVNVTVNGKLIMGTKTIDANNNVSGTFNLQVSAGGTIATARAGGLGTALTGSTGTLTNFNTTARAIINTAANIEYNGSAAQVTGAILPSTVNSLTFSNSVGVTLSQAMTATNLTLIAGKVTGNVTLGSSTAVSGGSSTAYLNGQLTVPFTTPNLVSYTFPIGTASAYSPISLASFSDVGTGTLTASATATQNPNQGTSGIDGSVYIARYWTLTDNGGFSSPTYNFTGTYVAGDIQNGADPANLIVRKWDGASWAAPASSASVAYTGTGTGFATSFGQFATGQAQTTMPIVDSTTKTAITNTSATLGATLENDFSLPVSDYGIVWGTTASPTTANNKVQVGTSLAAPNSFTANVTGLPVATTIYYRGYAINSSGTGYSTNGSFITLTNEPTSQASGVNIVARQNGNLTVSWTRGNGSKCIVLVKAGSTVDSAPVDGSTYTASATFGSGTQIGSLNYVAYLGTGSSVTITTLSAATTYYVAVYELNGSGGSENYLAPPATGSQTTVTTPITLLTWNGNADADWNNTNNWDAFAVPDVGTAVTIPAGTTYSPVYSNQMVAASAGSVTDSGVLTIATNGFNIVAASAVPLTIQAGGNVTINTNGVLTITDSGSVTMVTPASGTSPVIDVEGGTLIVTNSSTFLMGDATGSDANIGAAFTNNNGKVMISSQLQVKGRDSRLYMSGGTFNTPGGIYLNVANNDMRQFFRFAGGTANLGAVNINRATTAGGLSVDGAVVNSSSIQIGTGIASASSQMNSGVWTNAGAFNIGDRNNPATGSRNTYFTMNSGDLVTLGAAGIVINNQGQATLAAPTDDGGNLIVNGGTITTEGIYLNGPSVTANAWARFQMSAGTIYLGAVGLVANTAGASMNADITLTGGTLAAKSDWTSVANIPLGGTITFKAADAAGTAHNITLNGAVSGGAGALVKTGAGTLTLNGVNSYSGATTISGGTLALGASGTLSSTPINLANGVTFDVSAPGGFTLGSGKSLSGSGTVAGAFAAASGSSITVGDTVGKLTFSSALTLSNNAVVSFEISPVTNDWVEVAGNLNVSSGTTTVSVAALGGVLAPGTYTLFHYGGAFIGTIGNLSLLGAPGYLTNNTTAQAIQLVTTGLRGPGSVVWVGNSLTNNWDVLNHTNWLNGVALDSFVQGDTVLFNATGAANPSVNITDPVNPASLTVDATTAYTFSGSGVIGGSGGLTKTNTGTLAVLTTNSYTGATIIGQGTLETSQLANGGANSGIGAANNSTNNLVFYSSTLKYTGASASTDHGAILNDAGGTINVTNSGSILTDNGTLVGTGALTKTGPGTLVLGTANTHSGGTVVANGILQINNATSLGLGGFTNMGATLKFGSALTAGETVDFSGNCIVDINNPSSTDVALRGAWSGNGYVLLTNLNNSARTFTMGGDGDGGGSMAGFSGTIDGGNCIGFLRFNDGANKNYGSPNAVFDLGSGGIVMLARNGAVTIDLGALRGGPNTRLAGRASGSSGTVTYSIGALGIATTFAGSITNYNNATAITKVGTNTLTLSGTNYHTGATTVQGGTLQVDGSILNSAVTVQAETSLTGNGSLNSVGVQGNGTLSPGASGIGKLTINTLTLESGSTNIIELNKSLGTNDSVVGLSSISYGGTLNVVNLGGTLAAGDTFKLYDSAGGYSGAFEATNLPALSGSLSWDTSTLSVDGTIKVVAPTTPAFTSVVIDGSNLIISGSNGVPSTPFYVLTSTNLALPLAGWTTIATNTFNLDGSFSVTNAMNPSLPQDFYILQLQ